MSNSNKALFAVIGLIIIIGGMVAFVGSGNNGGVVPTPMATPMMTATPSAMATAMPTASGSTIGANVKADVELTIHGGGFYYKPDVMKVKKGQIVKITYINDGGMHDFNIDELNVHSRKIQTGETDVLLFTAGQTGTFEYYCSVGQHRQMGQKGTLTVE